MALSVEIEKGYGAFQLQVSLQADREVLALLGASGCGKSLTLKCIAGIERPDRGRIELDGRVLFDSEKKINLPPQQRRVGYLFQHYALFPHMTAEQNIAAGAHQLPAALRKQRVRELMQMLRLSDAAGKRPRQLSGGQQQRVALARILASEPEMILLDEPFSALDHHLKWQLEQELQELLSSFPGTVLWVSHDLGEVYRNCRRVCVLTGGRSVPVESLEETVRSPKTIGAAQLTGIQNLPAVPAGKSSVSIPLWNTTLRCAVSWPSDALRVGLRNLHIAAPGEENIISCRVIRTVEDLTATLVLLLPEGGETDAPLLRLSLPKGTRIEDACLQVAVAPADLLPLY